MSDFVRQVRFGKEAKISHFADDKAQRQWSATVQLQRQVKRLINGRRTSKHVPKRHAFLATIERGNERLQIWGCSPIWFVYFQRITAIGRTCHVSC